MNKSKANDRICEKHIMNCGLEAEIIEYFRRDNITIQFEDGVIVTNKAYKDFKKGCVRHPFVKTPKNRGGERGSERLGITKMMNCGLKATIVAYRSSTDIDVQFKDGYLATNKCYSSFKIGAIRHSGVSCKSKQNLGETRIGETRKMKCNLDATIISYESNKNITVQFEDGVTKKTSYFKFTRGRVPYSNNPGRKFKNNHMGESKTMNCGLSATIIAYRCFNDIDIQFEDGIVVYSKQYSSFKNGYIAHPHKNLANERLGMTKMMKCGLNATIVTYRGSCDIDVKFENECLVTNKRYSSFIAGRIDCPMCLIN